MTSSVNLFLSSRLMTILCVLAWPDRVSWLRSSSAAEEPSLFLPPSFPPCLRGIPEQWRVSSNSILGVSCSSRISAPVRTVLSKTKTESRSMGSGASPRSGSLRVLDLAERKDVSLAQQLPLKCCCSWCMWRRVGQFESGRIGDDDESSSFWEWAWHVASPPSGWWRRWSALAAEASQSGEDMRSVWMFMLRFLGRCDLERSFLYVHSEPKEQELTSPEQFRISPLPPEEPSPSPGPAVPE